MDEELDRGDTVRPLVRGAAMGEQLLARYYSVGGGGARGKGPEPLISAGVRAGTCKIFCSK